MEGLQRTTKKEALDSLTGSQSPEKRIRELENKGKYLEQQMEF